MAKEKDGFSSEFKSFKLIWIFILSFYSNNHIFNKNNYDFINIKKMYEQKELTGIFARELKPFKFL
jgi:hypothetical protein